MATPFRYMRRLGNNKLVWPVNPIALSYCCLSDLRVRFAPSPTGALHLGGLRTALYNFLFAKANSGKIILRIEDTDQARTIPSAIADIENDLAWMSVTFDESPKVGGPYGSYIQSERIDIYKAHSHKLLESGHAYKCFCSSDRLLALNKNSLPYDNKCRTLSQSEIKKFEDEGTPYCVRLKLQDKAETFEDIVYGPRSIQLSVKEGDTIIMKTNGIPTYHLANVIDDHLMKITHVLRGVEWLPSTIKHLLVYKAFKWEPPQFAHLPQMNNLDGTKLSKRNKALHVGELRLKGYSPSCILNFVKSAGRGYQNMNYEKISTLEELIEQFRIERIGTGSTTLDMDKLLMYSRMDLQNKLINEQDRLVAVEQLRDYVEKEFGSCLDVELSDSYLLQVMNWGKERVCKLKDFISPEFSYLWTPPQIDADKVIILKVDSKKVIADVVYALEKEEFSLDKVKEILNFVTQKNSATTVTVMKLLRIVMCGSLTGPPVAELFLVLGKERCIERLRKISNRLK